MIHRVRLVLRLAARDLRGGLRGLRVFLACVTIGVAAITGVGSVANSLLGSIATQGSVMLGGDLAFSRSQRPLNGQERAWLADQGRLSEIATMRATARTTTDEATTVEIKAVDSAYPLAGAVESEPRLALDQAFAEKDGAFGALADVALMERLSLGIGDFFRIGQGLYVLRGQIGSEPDRIASGLGFGPRVMVSTRGLEASGLQTSASLIRWSARLALPPPAEKAAVQKVIDAASHRFSTSGWDVRTRDNVSPQLSRNVERFSQFMALIGVVSLIVGGVGIAGAVTAFVDRKRESIAILKALGASGAVVFQTLLVEMMAIALCGSVLGVAVGVAIPFAVAGVVGPVLDLPFEPTISLASTLQGLTMGVLASLAFVIAPAGRAHDTQVAALFRLATAATEARLRVRYGVAAVCSFLALVAFVYFVSSEKQVALIAVGGVTASAVVLRGVAWAVSRAAGRAPHSRFLALRLALGNIRRPGAVTVPVVTSLGLGLTLLVAIVGVDGNIRRQLSQGQPGRTPDFFFIDVQSGQADEFRNFLTARRPQDRIETAPILRGRIVRVGSRRADEIKPESNAAWVLEGDRGITFSDFPPEGSEVVEGRWWGADYTGPPLVSMDAEIARGLSLKIGDEVGVNVAGRIIVAKLANLRRVDWRSFGINFVLVFSPATFAGAPHTKLFSIRSPDGVARHDATLIRDMAKAYPSVTALGVREALDQALSLVEKLSTAVRSASAVTLTTALLVLAGALAAGQRARIYDAVILRSLGATRRLLSGAYLLEFAALGAATALFAVGAGMLAAWAIVTGLMSLDFSWNPGPMAFVLALGCLLTILLGLAATFRVLGEKPARVLREL